MPKNINIDKFLIVTLVFLSSLSIGYLPVSAGAIAQEENVSPTRASIWLSLEK